jgi:hypothetical protein
VDIAHSKILYIYTVSYTQFRDSELTLLSEPLAMDARVRKDGHPMPEVAAFMAKLRAAFGDKLIDDAVRRRSFSHAKMVVLLEQRLPRARIRGWSTKRFAVDATAMVATANVSASESAVVSG